MAVPELKDFKPLTKVLFDENIINSNYKSEREVEETTEEEIKWNALIEGNSAGIQKITDGINSVTSVVNDTVDFAFSIVRTATELLKTISDVIPEQIDPLETAIKSLRDQILEVVESITFPFGVNGMYILPHAIFEKEGGTSRKTFEELKNDPDFISFVSENSESMIDQLVVVNYEPLKFNVPESGITVVLVGEFATLEQFLNNLEGGAYPVGTVFSQNNLFVRFGNDTLIAIDAIYEKDNIVFSEYLDSLIQNKNIFNNVESHFNIVESPNNELQQYIELYNDQLFSEENKLYNRLATKFEDFWDQFNLSFIDEDQRTIPNYKNNEGVWGFSLILLAPSIEPVIDSFKKLGNLFNLDQFKNDFGLSEVVDFAIKGSRQNQNIVLGLLLKLNVDLVGNNFITLQWKKFSFKHKLKIKFIRTNLEDQTKDEFLIQIDNISENKEDYVYKINFDNNKAVRYKRGGSEEEELNADIKSLYKKNTQYTVTVELSKITELNSTDYNLVNAQTGTLNVPEQSNQFFGNQIARTKQEFGNSKWFGDTIEGMFPFLSQTRESINTMINNIYDSFVDEVDELSILSEIINDKIKDIEKVIFNVKSSINNFIDTLKIADFSEAVAGIYTKDYYSKEGGIEEWKRFIKNMDGIPVAAQREAVYAAGFFIVIGGWSDDTIIKRFRDFWSLIFPRSSKDEDIPVTVQIENETDKFKILEELFESSNFNINGTSSPYLGLE